MLELIIKFFELRRKIRERQIEIELKNYQLRSNLYISLLKPKPREGIKDNKGNEKDNFRFMWRNWGLE